MKQRVLIDTWFLIAWLRQSDGDHARAKRLWQAYGGAELITHDGVLVEFLTYFAASGPRVRAMAATSVRRLTSYEIVVVPQDRTLFLDALAHYEDRLDKGYSLVDCMSMVVMRQRGVAHVLTNDHHFRQEGFTVLSDAS